jgi:RimJ/RimL family protein N-acetyltransferase
MDGAVVIAETERLLLREFVESDATDFYVLGSDPQIIRYTGDPGGGFRSVEHAMEILHSHPMADYRNHGYGRWAVIHKESGRLIGFAGLKYLEELDDIDLGYRLIPEYWGHGLATESALAVRDYGFEDLSLEEVIGLVHPENVASERILKKLGMEFVGVIQYSGLDVHKYLMTRSHSRK